MPNGTFTQKIADQSNASISRPPATGPAPKPRPAIMAQMPIAQCRRSAGNASTMIDSASGASIAAPTPCSARIAISISSLVESAQPAEKAVNHTKPSTNTRFRPYRSPSVPPTSRSDANASR
jgi:hypothetical protein